MIRVFAIGGRIYEIQAPSIRNIILATETLGELPQNINEDQLFNNKDKEELSIALSILHKGDLSIFRELMKGSKDELVEALKTLYTDTFEFLCKLQTISANISHITAKSK